MPAQAVDLRPALFLDRDGTLIVDTHYPNDPAHVVLMPGVADAVAQVNALGIPVVVITNQSGIARGLISDEQYNAVRERLDALLAESGAQLDASYHCPHWPDASGPCECRKPGLALYERAARDHHLDLAASVCIGDRWRDVAPALALGGTGILVPAPNTPLEDRLQAERAAQTAPDLRTAITIALAALRVPR